MLNVKSPRIQPDPWNCYEPRLKVQALRKPKSTDMVKAAHAITWELPCQLLSILRVKFLRLRTYKMKTQRSYFQNVTIKSDCTAKVTKKKKPTNYHKQKQSKIIINRTEPQDKP